MNFTHLKLRKRDQKAKGYQLVINTAIKSRTLSELQLASKQTCVLEPLAFVSLVLF